MSNFAIFLLFCLANECYSNSLVVAPIQGEIDLREEARNMHLTVLESRQIADMIVKKNFSIFIEFKQNLYNQGSLLAIYSGAAKVLELYSDGLRDELRIRWRRDASLATRYTQDIDFDNGEWHVIIFELHGDDVQMTKDCSPFLSESFPELEFGMLKLDVPKVWIGQGGPTGSMLLGKIRQFKVKEGSFLAEVCGIQLHESDPSASPGLQSQDSNSLRAMMNEFRVKMHNVEESMKKFGSTLDNLRKDVDFLKLGFDHNVLPTHPGPMDTTKLNRTQGTCPNCYEYFLHKTNYLENEFKRWRVGVEKVDAAVKHVALFQRGCTVNGTVYRDGDRWSAPGCVVCTCHAGKAHCHPMGCVPPSHCARPTVIPGECCPTCGHNCFYMQKTYEDGAIFRPKPCTTCECKNSHMECTQEDPSLCPALACPQDQRITLENSCCPVCANADRCAGAPCHPDASCVNSPPHRFECTCRSGYFGDGYKNCYDVDECRSPAHKATETGDDHNETNNINKKKAKLGLNQSDSQLEKSAGSSIGPCGAGTRCVNTPGSYRCECLAGFSKMGENTCFDTLSQ